jgi:uncharacterized protein YecE (DUF72 family)
MLKIGLCGFTMSAAEYFETFPVVEVQQTFYEPPATATLERWRGQAPPEFEFTMKAWQILTHAATSNTYRRLKTPLTPGQKAQCGGFRWNDTTRMAWTRTLACARILRTTAILFQCPASFRALPENDEAMRRFFAAVERPQGVRFLWEPRGPWPDERIAGLCGDLHLTHVVDPFLRSPVTTGLTYWRMHGRGSHYKSYTDGELATLAAQLPARGETYAMFNNIPRVGDARRFARMTSAPPTRAGRA